MPIGLVIARPGFPGRGNLLILKTKLLFIFVVHFQYQEITSSRCLGIRNDGSTVLFQTASFLIIKTADNYESYSRSKK